MILNRTCLFSLIALFLVFCACSSTKLSGTDVIVIPTGKAQIAEGQMLFRSNCRVCHEVNNYLIGPALAGVDERAPSIEWIFKFVRNSQEVIRSGDPYAMKLYQSYNQTQMASFPSFTDSEILNILAYIKSESLDSSK